MAEITPENTAIEKLKIIKEMSQSPETQQLSNVMIEYLITKEDKPAMGFASKENKS